MRTRIRTGITSKKGVFKLWETCNKHKITWVEGEPDPSKCCMECIKKARPTRYKRSLYEFIQ